ncbi:MAG: ATP-dependent zinc metalloprotease FtsH [Bacilli bacterium]
MSKKDNKRNFLSYGLIICFFLAVFMVFNSLGAKANNLTYDEFMKNLNEGKVTELELTPKQASAVYEIVGKLEGYSKNESFEIKVPYSDSVISEILSVSDNKDLKVTVNKDPDGSSIWTIIINFLPFALLIGFAFYFLTRQVGGANKSLDFGKSKAKLHSDKDKVTFDDVAGLVEEKYEVKELIDFLKSPKKFQKLGARIPKGVLLVGPPGTGKTLLARAVAGEANVPFYYISGSDFVELFVGVGASRVRDMFKQAKQTAPCLIFIDEIDAVGRQRGTGLGGGHDEREQTLNQLLTEMDGFGANEGIIIIAATNRPDVLDPALLRPGRFDRQVTVSLPDVSEREAILKVHAKNKVLAKDVTLKYLANRTSGFSGADLENLLNEAALLAVRRNKTEITMSEIDEAHDRVLMGPAKKSRKVSEKDKKITAYHEAGHVVAGLKQENSNIVQKVTIIPRGMAGGYTNIQSEEEKMHTTRNELIETICTLLAGRVAEQITFDDITTGAENDIERATKIARAMVCEYGMSELGPVQLEQNESSVFLGRDYNKTRNFSDKIAFEIDQQIRKIIDGCYARTEKILKENKKLLDLIAINLAKYETLTKEQIEYLVENGHMKEEDSNDEDHSEMSVSELKNIAKDKGIKGYSKMSKEELIDAINDED